LVQGDAEHLPFKSDAFHVSFVHDGLHHLEQPDRAIREMARVADSGVVVTEPADAALTKLAIALHLIPAREDAGNLVIRFDATSLRRLLSDLGFSNTASARYLVKYGHPPSGWWRLFDAPPLFRLARAAFVTTGAGLFARYGNKVSVAGAMR
jgi:ubiquinone/menaquinone biosynthesis C-methylase UbiE